MFLRGFGKKPFRLGSEYPLNDFPHSKRQLNKSEHSRHTSRATQIPQQRQTFALSNTAVKSSVHKVSTKVVQDHRRLTFALANFTRASYE